ncbi:MAG: hypothetical protein IK016_07505, partial [Lachnospiraceae bacterium]|nr:hypothetical protein [Lachnospiraceae bacterium]
PAPVLRQRTGQDAAQQTDTARSASATRTENATRSASQQQTRQTQTQSTRQQQRQSEEAKLEDWKREAQELRSRKKGVKKKSRKKKEKEAHADVLEESKGKFLSLSDVMDSKESKYDAAKQKLFEKIDVRDENNELVCLSQKQILDEVRIGNYRHFEKMDRVFQNVASKEYMEELRIDGVTEASTPEQVVEALCKKKADGTTDVSGLINPLFRTGLSVCRHYAGSDHALKTGVLANKNKDYYDQLESLCNKRMMRETIKAIPAAGTLDDVRRQKVINSAKLLARTMALCHLGNGVQMTETKADDSQETKTWETDVASLFAHCSRVAVVLPGARQTYQSYAGNIGGKQDALGTRMMSTHWVEQKTKGDDSGASVERKGASIRKQYGGALSIGGYGNTGLNGSVISNDGTNGAIMLTAKVAETEASPVYTSFLFGIESDGVYKTNHLGHTHDIFATPEAISSFGGLRVDEVGDKYGGRNIDLSKMDPAVFEEVMRLVDQKMDELIQQNDEAAWNGFLDQLCGHVMKQQDLFNLIGYDPLAKTMDQERENLRKHKDGQGDRLPGVYTPEFDEVYNKVMSCSMEELRDPELQEKAVEQYNLAMQRRLSEGSSVNTTREAMRASTRDTVMMNVIARSAIPNQVLQNLANAVIRGDKNEQLRIIRDEMQNGRVGELYRKTLPSFAGTAAESPEAASEVMMENATLFGFGMLITPFLYQYADEQNMDIAQKARFISTKSSETARYVTDSDRSIRTPFVESMVPQLRQQ